MSAVKIERMKHPYHDDSMWNGASAQIFANAKQLREKLTAAESALWDKLKGNQFYGLKFRRQHPINKYIADFYCHELKLIIEIDGGYHESEEQINIDLERVKILAYNNYKVVRFSNRDVENNINSVLLKLSEFLP